MTTPVTVNIEPAVDAFLGLAVTAVADVKAGKSALSIVEDLVPQLVSSLAQMGDLQAELSDVPDLLNTVALKGSALIQLFLTQSKK